MALRHRYFTGCFKLTRLSSWTMFSTWNMYFFLNMCLQIADFCVCVGKKTQYHDIAAHFQKTVRPPKTCESRHESRDHGFFRALDVCVFLCFSYYCTFSFGNRGCKRLSAFFLQPPSCEYSYSALHALDITHSITHNMQHTSQWCNHASTQLS